MGKTCMWFNGYEQCDKIVTMKEYTSTRIWLNTIKNLRMIYALTGESMVSIMDKLVLDELNRQKILLDSKILEKNETEV